MVLGFSLAGGAGSVVLKHGQLSCLGPVASDQAHDACIEGGFLTGDQAHDACIEGGFLTSDQAHDACIEGGILNQ